MNLFIIQENEMTLLELTKKSKEAKFTKDIPENLNLRNGQRPKYAIFTGTSENVGSWLFGFEPGEAFWVRTEELNNLKFAQPTDDSILYAVEHLGVKNIIILSDTAKAMGDKNLDLASNHITNLVKENGDIQVVKALYDINEGVVSFDKNYLRNSEPIDELEKRNNKFVNNSLQKHIREKIINGETKAEGLIYMCSDSRLVEKYLGIKQGDFKIVRVAGNIIPWDDMKKTVIQAMDKIKNDNDGNAILIVNGHEKCGAIAASRDFVLNGGGHEKSSLIEAISPCIDITKKVEENTKDNSEYVCIEFKKMLGNKAEIWDSYYSFDGIINAYNIDTKKML